MPDLPQIHVMGMKTNGVLGNAIVVAGLLQVWNTNRTNKANSIHQLVGDRASVANWLAMAVDNDLVDNPSWSANNISR